MLQSGRSTNTLLLLLFCLRQWHLACHGLPPPSPPPLTPPFSQPVRRGGSLPPLPLWLWPTLPLPRITPFMKQSIRLFPPSSKRRNNNVLVAFPPVPLVTMIIWRLPTYTIDEFSGIYTKREDWKIMQKQRTKNATINHCNNLGLILIQHNNQLEVRKNP